MFSVFRPTEYTHETTYTTNINCVTNSPLFQIDLFFFAVNISNCSRTPTLLIIFNIFVLVLAVLPFRIMIVHFRVAFVHAFPFFALRRFCRWLRLLYWLTRHALECDAHHVQLIYQYINYIQWLTNYSKTAKCQKLAFVALLLFKSSLPLFKRTRHTPIRRKSALSLSPFSPRVCFLLPETAFLIACMWYYT